MGSKIKDPGRAWALVLEHADMVLDTIAWHLSQSLSRSVSYKGSWPELKWTASGHFFGREAVDYVEDAVPTLLEAAAVALERWDPERGTPRTVVNTYVKNAAIDVHKSVVEEEAALPFLRDEGEKTASGDPYYGSGVLEDEYFNDMALEEDEVTELSVALTEEEGYAVSRDGDGASLAEIAEDLDQFFPLPDGAKRSRFQARNVLDRALRKARKVAQ